MHFDDRLATVLRQPASGDALARIQYRQLVDILGRSPDKARSDAVEAAYTRLAALSRRIPARDRARLLRQPLQPLASPRLFAFLAEAEPEVATAAIGTARLSETDWLRLIPRLPVRARGILRHRRDLPANVELLLERLGIRDRALPPALGQPAPEQSPAPDQPPAKTEAAPAIPLAPRRPQTEEEIEDLVLTEMLGPDDAESEGKGGAPEAFTPTPPTSLAEWAKMKAAAHHPAADRSEAGIGAIVKRIEEFRKARETQGPQGLAGLFEQRSDSPRLPLGDGEAAPLRGPSAIDFATDAESRLTWADGAHASSVIGFRLDAQGSAPGSAGDIATALRQRLPISGARIVLSGAPAICGEWQVDATARFDPVGGRFIGYNGRLRRPTAPLAQPAANPRAGEADRMRQVLHELRTPANAIQVAAEIIQQQVFGPAPHEYRALAASIASDCAHILAGFEELDRLVKLETGALVLEAGDCDLAEVVTTTLERLRSWTEPRSTGFSPEGVLLRQGLPVGMDRAEAERLVWRLLAALAGVTAPDEWLAIDCMGLGQTVALRIALPAVLAAREGEDIFDNLDGGRAHSLSAGMFGVGFTLRLAAAEAAAAGGRMQRVDNQLVLVLPALTVPDAVNSNVATGSH